MADPVLTFDAPAPAGVTVTGGSVVTGSVVNVTRAPNDTAYLTVPGGQSATVTADQGYEGISFDWGSPDYYNILTIFDTLGNIIASLTGAATGNVGNPTTSSFVYQLNQGHNTTGIGSLKFYSSTNAFEVDNIAFKTPTAQVPEPSMIGIFATASLALIAKRRRAKR